MNAQDCKQFLVDFFSKNHQVILGLFPDMPDEENKKLISELTDIKHWKQRYYSKPGNSMREFRDYGIYEDGTAINHWGEPSPYITKPLSGFISERGFDLDISEGQIAYLVLEDKDGKLHLGNYIGD